MVSKQLGPKGELSSRRIDSPLVNANLRFYLLMDLFSKFIHRKLSFLSDFQLADVLRNTQLMSDFLALEHEH